MPGLSARPAPWVAGFFGCFGAQQPVQIRRNDLPGEQQRRVWSRGMQPLECLDARTHALRLAQVAEDAEQGCALPDAKALPKPCDIRGMRDFLRNAKVRDDSHSLRAVV